MKTHVSFMSNCMHQNIIKYIPYSFKTLRSRRVLQKVKFKRTRALVIHYFIALECNWFDLLTLIMTLCYDYVMNYSILLKSLRQTIGTYMI